VEAAGSSEALVHMNEPTFAPKKEDVNHHSQDRGIPSSQHLCQNHKNIRSSDLAFNVLFQFNETDLRNNITHN
jgi:hypothetical protein